MSLIRIRWSYRSRTYRSLSAVIPGIVTTWAIIVDTMSRCGGDQLAHHHDLALELEQRGQLRLLRVHEDLVLQLVDALVHRGQVREHGVHERVEQPVQRDQAP